MLCSARYSLLFAQILRKTYHGFLGSFADVQENRAERETEEADLR